MVLLDRSAAAEEAEDGTDDSNDDDEYCRTVDIITEERKVVLVDGLQHWTAGD